jgi:hypothetical protein
LPGAWCFKLLGSGLRLSLSGENCGVGVEACKAVGERVMWLCGGSGDCLRRFRTLKGPSHFSLLAQRKVTQRNGLESWWAVWVTSLDDYALA